MAETPTLKDPWLVAVWPGMGQVALNGGVYLLSKLGMSLFAELKADELFDVEHVEVKGGLIHTTGLPRSRLFLWQDPQQRHDIVLFLGEAQPPVGKYAFCHRLIEYARQLGVERVFTFAAMATQMHPADDCRIFGAATDETALEELKRLELELLDDGHIGGLNGVLLGAAAQEGLRGTCLLGEMPQMFAQLPFPKASLAVLEVFTTITGIDIDFTELSQQADAMEQQLGDLLEKVKEAMARQAAPEEESFDLTPPEKDGLDPEDERRIEELFKQAEDDRSRAYELKRELDRLNVFRKYEDRFLDLFQQ